MWHLNHHPWLAPPALAGQEITIDHEISIIIIIIITIIIIIVASIFNQTRYLAQVFGVLGGWLVVHLHAWVLGVTHDLALQYNGLQPERSKM